MTEAHRRDLRVITELVINHTSDQHPWFKRARRSGPTTDARNWYVWSDDDKKYAGTRIIFTDTEKSNWAWDNDAKAYYWHRFFSHQPDLNFDNPRVLWALVQVMRRWLDMGVDGFRLDAIPYLCERDGTNNENLPETHAIIKKIRKELDAYAPGKVLLAEANQWPEDVSAYFGDGDECQMAYHFPLMPRIYMAIAQEDRFPIADILRQTPDIPANCQWALFLRNHDELTLEMVTDVERDYLWSTYANDPRARINLGIRRRLASLMDNDRRKIELMNSLLFSLPGTPIVYYGDEIGMGDNIYLGDRNGVRTPMQWTSDRNGGFSRCDPARLFLPVIMDPVYGHQSVNVEAQQRSPSSFLNWMKRLIGVRRSSNAFSRGTLSFVRPSNRTVLAYVRQYENDTIVCVANLSRSAQAAEIDLSPWKGRVPMEMLGRTAFPRIGELPYLVTLPPYGFFWFLLGDPSEPDAEARNVPRETITLVWAGDRNSPLATRERYAFEHDVLPHFLLERRWFADKARGLPAAKLENVIELERDGVGAWLTIVGVPAGRQATSRYLLPLMVKWTRFDRSAVPANAIAAVRRGRQEGTLIDAGGDQDFVTMLLRLMHAGDAVEAGAHRLEALPTSAFKQMPPPAADKIVVPNREQSNTTVIVDDACVVKIFRKVQRRHSSGNRDRALPDRADRIQERPRPAGIDRAGRGRPTQRARRSRIASSRTRAMPGRSPKPISAASSTTSACCRRRQCPRKARSSPPTCSRWRRSARRTGELQTALASRPRHRRTSRPSRSARPTSQAWTERLVERSHRTFDLLAEKRGGLAEAEQALVDRMLQRASGDHRSHPEIAAGLDPGGQGPPSRRLPSRPGAGRQGRCFHPRLRGRTGPLARRAPRARRRRRAMSPG